MTGRLWTEWRNRLFVRTGRQNKRLDSWNLIAAGAVSVDHGPEQTVDSSAQQQADAEDRGTEVKRSEGGPGRGYYLNGKFYPYTDDEKDGQ